MKSLTKQLSFSLLLISFVTLAFTACKKSDDPAPTYTNNPSGGNNRYFRATIGTQNINYTENNSTTFGDRGAGGITENQDTWLVYSGSLYNPFQGIKNSAFLQIGNVHLTGGAAKPSDADFNSFLSIGSKNYTGTTDEKTFDGVMILWFDENGDQWSSIGDQTGSTFTVTQGTRYAATATSNAKTYLDATFSCKLYNGSETKTVTNGTLYLMFENMEKLN